MNCNNNNLTSLSVSGYSGLRILRCRNNQLTLLSLAIKDQGSAIYELNCGGNQLTSLDVSECTGLQTLVCDNNNLTTLSLSHNTQLLYLSCWSNRITSLNLSNNKLLNSIDCSSNQIKGEGMDTFINNLPKKGNVPYSFFHTIYAGNENNIMTIAQVEAVKEKNWNPMYYDGNSWQEYFGSDPLATDVEINETNFPDEIFRNWVLSQPFIHNNILTPSDLSTFTQIKVSNKNIGSLKGIEFFTMLNYLECNQNQLTSLDLSKNVRLTYLTCTNNQLSSLSVSGCTELTTLNCQNNQLISLDVSGCTALKDLSCYLNQIKGAAMDAFVESLPVRTCTIKLIDTTNPNEQNIITTTQVETAKSKGGKPMYYILSSGYNARLYWSEYFGSDPSMGEGVEINEENFPDENFRNWALGQRNASDGVLTPIELESYKTISINNNGIKSLTGVEYFVFLESLGCEGNQITTLDVSTFKEMTYLNCSNNQLTSLDVSQNTKLTELHIYKNQIKGVNMDALIESLPIVNNKYIYVISDENEGNVMTTIQVEAAKAKGWIPQYMGYRMGRYGYVKGWVEYEGSEPYLRGDANGDGVINGTDIQTIINSIVEGEYNEKGDVNEDGQVNGTDIQEVINIIVNAE